MKLSAAKGWVNTGYNVGSMSGLYVNIHSTGFWCCRNDNVPYGTRDAGGRGRSGQSNLVSVEGDERYPYLGPGARMGQLIGKFQESGEIFVVNENKSIVIQSVPAGLPLFLRINFPTLSDCSGEIDIQFSTSDGILDKPPAEYYDRIAQRWIKS